mgnify:CR=1 FL=1
MPKISIVTVTYNAEKLIKDTIESVLSQTYCDYEYVFVDGRSSDDTCKIIAEYIEILKRKGISTTYISEADNGIYDAMNKGADLAKGEWIYFLNAGDSFVENNVLEKVSCEFEDNIDIVYGGTVYCHSNGDIAFTGRGEDVTIMPKHMPFCVQASFVRNEIQNKYQYDLNYRISADYNFFLQVYKNGHSFKKIDLIINKYLLGGFSSAHPFKTYLEVGKIREKQGYLNRKSPIYIMKVIRFYLLCMLKRGKKSC